MSEYVKFSYFSHIYQLLNSLAAMYPDAPVKGTFQYTASNTINHLMKLKVVILLLDSAKTIITIF